MPAHGIKPVRCRVKPDAALGESKQRLRRAYTARSGGFASTTEVSIWRSDTVQ